MNKRIFVWFIIAMLAVGIVGCSKEKEEDSGDKPEKSKVTIYYANSNADGFETEEVELDALTPENLWQELVTRNVVSAEVKISSLTTPVEDDSKKIILDLSHNFQSYFYELGTADEYYLLGSISNTFLSAYECESILITVDGETLESGHDVYSEYMKKFQ